MTITLALNVFRWRVGTFDIRLDMDENPIAAPAAPKLLDSVSDYFATRWFARHT